MFEQTVIVLLILLTLGLGSAGIATMWLGRTRGRNADQPPSRQQVTWVLVTLAALLCASVASAGLVVTIAPPMGPVRYVGAGVIGVLFFSLAGAALTVLADALELRRRQQAQKVSTRESASNTDSWDLDDFIILDFRDNVPQSVVGSASIATPLPPRP